MAVDTGTPYGKDLASTSAPSRRGEGGYVTAMTALLLIPLMVFAALTVDVGAWYFQASDAQGAADAAALAGVPFMPDRARAQAAALDVATRNGYTDGVDGATVIITYPSPSSISVEIDTPYDRYFSGIVLNETFDIKRAGTAEYTLPIPMGSPVNVLGFGPNNGPLRAGDMAAANYWLLEGSDCQPAHHGDLRAAKYEFKTDGSWCGNHGPARAIWKKNTEGRSGGYFYVVDIPPGQTEVSEFWVYDPGVCGDDGHDKPSDMKNEKLGSRIGWRVWSSNNTPPHSRRRFPRGRRHLLDLRRLRRRSYRRSKRWLDQVTNLLPRQPGSRL